MFRSARYGISQNRKSNLVMGDGEGVDKNADKHLE